MAISNKLKSLYNKVALALGVAAEFTEALPDCYEAVEDKGGTLPAQQTAANLPTAIESIQALTGPVVVLANAPNFKGRTEEYLGEDLIKECYINFDSMCQNCTNIKSFDIRNWNITGVSGTYMRTAFYWCSSLEVVRLDNNTIPTNMSYGTYDLMFGQCTNLRVIRVGAWCNRSINISQAGAMTRETIVDFLTDLPTPVDNAQTITLGAAKLNLLTADDRAIATNKGWTLA